MIELVQARFTKLKLINTNNTLYFTWHVMQHIMTFYVIYNNTTTRSF